MDNKKRDFDTSNMELRKGVRMGDSPYLMRENNPDPYRDAHVTSEKFVPLPEMHTGEESKTKRIFRCILIGLIVAFLITAFIAIYADVPQTLFRGDAGRGHFFG